MKVSSTLTPTLTGYLERVLYDHGSIGAINLIECSLYAQRRLPRAVRGEPFVQQTQTRVGLGGPADDVITTVAQPLSQQAPVTIVRLVH